MEVSENSINKSEVPKPCIYRVPSRIRNVKPEAYTPRILLIGPLHRSFKVLDDGAETSSNPWDLKKEYLKMEDVKKKYLESYTKKVGEDTIEEMRKTIQADEKNIRASYQEEESTDLISSEYFVDVILQDSVFIMEVILRDTIPHDEESHDKIGPAYPNGNMLDQSYASMVMDDLLLLENQLPYFIFDSLFCSSLTELDAYSLKKLIMNFFGLTVEENTNFKHFTDMLRYVYEESLDLIPRVHVNINRWPHITELRNADYLLQAGVDFMAPSDAWGFENYKDLERMMKLGFSPFRRSRMFHRLLNFLNKRPRIDGLSLHVEFKKGVLMLPGFQATEMSEIILRNVIAFEQCYVDVTPFTSNYIHFLNFLITSHKDVELLIEKGVIKNTMGRQSLVLGMVNKLQDGVKVATSSQYSYVAKNLRDHYKSRRKRCWATLRNVYFSDLWTGTATLAAVFLLLLTLIGTVASVIQAYKSF